MKRILLVAVAVLAVTASAAQAAKPVKYSGKTKEGTKISFVLKNGWADQIKTSVPSSCVSAQGGTPRVRIDSWQPPYKFRMPAKEAKVTVKEPWPTRTYGFSARKSGRGVKGKLTLSYSMTDYTWATSWRLLTCYGTASFSLKPR
jgi:hypothetical protein